ncbi:MAG: hypothetical protein PWP37_700 [Thermotogota bacterium]|nr:hypothetical protein [Thermotogota bacterium]
MKMLWLLATIVVVEGIVLVFVVLGLRRLWLQRIRGDEIIAIEERVLELMGRFKQLADTKIKTLETKIEQLKSLIQQANNILSALNVLVSEAEQDFMRLEEALEKVKADRNDLQVMEEKTPREFSPDSTAVEDVALTSVDSQKKTEEEMGIEQRILLLNSQGFDEIAIARKLGIGVGEVRLILSLFSRRFTRD